MFFARRPSSATIERFLLSSHDLPLSYNPVGIVSSPSTSRDVYEVTVRIGRGEADFRRARAALTGWAHFNVGWIETFPREAPIVVGTVVAVLIRHLGFWSLNGCRIVYRVDEGGGEQRFGFAYGTLTNHAESGEELFEVFIDPQTDDVMYRIRAASWPQALLARVGHPIVRALQQRFRAHSVAAMERAIRSAA
jgi:uncharacterized protein (UPF0548 family)